MMGVEYIYIYIYMIDNVHCVAIIVIRRYYCNKSIDVR